MSQFEAGANCSPSPQVDHVSANHMFSSDDGGMYNVRTTIQMTVVGGEVKTSFSVEDARCLRYPTR